MNESGIGTATGCCIGLGVGLWLGGFSLSIVVASSAGAFLVMTVIAYLYARGVV